MISAMPAIAMCSPQCLRVSRSMAAGSRAGLGLRRGLSGAERVCGAGDCVRARRASQASAVASPLRGAAMRSRMAQLAARHPALLAALRELLHAAPVLLPDRYGAHILPAELLTAAADLLSAAHAQFLGKPVPADVCLKGSGSGQLRTLLVVIQSSQILLEILAWRIGGKRSRWVTILLIELLK